MFRNAINFPRETYFFVVKEYYSQNLKKQDLTIFFLSKICSKHSLNYTWFKIWICLFWIIFTTKKYRCVNKSQSFVNSLLRKIDTEDYYQSRILFYLVTEIESLKYFIPFINEILSIRFRKIWNIDPTLFQQLKKICFILVYSWMYIINSEHLILMKKGVRLVRIYPIIWELNKFNYYYDIPMYFSRWNQIRNLFDSSTSGFRSNLKKHLKKSLNSIYL